MIKEIKIISLTQAYALEKAEEILALENNWTEIGDESWNIDNLIYELPMKWELSHVALYDGKMVGYQIGSLRDNGVFLNKIVVSREIRGKGIGKKLLKAFLGKSIEKGIQRVRFRVRIDNPAVEFYNKVGFIPEEKIDNSRPDGVESYFYDMIIEEVLANFDKSKKIIPHSKPHVDEEDINAVANQVKSGLHAYGNKTEIFEKNLCKLIKKDFGKATTSGTTALHLSLASLELEESDEIIIPSFTCQSLLNAINYTKAKPVLSDIQDDYLELGFNISLDTIKPLVNKNTKVIIVPHLFGVPADIESIVEFANKHNITVIEDCAQSIGAEYKDKPLGHYGHLSVFSFYATKVISTGQGGMVLTSIPKLKEKLIDLTTYDNREEYKPALNYTLTDIQAALGIKQLEKLSKLIDRRRGIGEKYHNVFKNEEKIKLANYEKGFPFRYIITLKNSEQRDELKNKLKEKGIDSELPFKIPTHKYLNLPLENFKNSEQAFETCLSIPIYPSLTDEEVDYVIKSVKESLRE